MKWEQNVIDTARSGKVKDILPLSEGSNTSVFPAGPFASEARNLPDLVANALTM